MATITVTTAADVVASDGVRSLREAVAQANATTGADTIVFASALEGRTLTLTQGELALTHHVTLDGDQNNDGTRVTLSGGDHSRILNIAGAGTDVTLRDMTLTHGFVPSGEDGGAIHSEGRSLSLNGCVVRDSTASAAPGYDVGYNGGYGGG